MKKWITPNTIMLLVFFIAIIHLHACMNTTRQAHKKRADTSKHLLKKDAMATPPSLPVADCDSSVWTHVYDPGRLQVLDRCKAVTGIITERNADPDGDEHMLLKLDKGQEPLLQKKNFTKKEGALVVEVVCVNHIMRKRAVGACDGYINGVLLPKVGDHVRVWGSYVIDSHNGWAEIHPATKIEKIN